MMDKDVRSSIVCLRYNIQSAVISPSILKFQRRMLSVSPGRIKFETSSIVSHKCRGDGVGVGEHAVSRHFNPRIPTPCLPAS